MLYDAPTQGKRLGAAEFMYINADLPVGLPTESTMVEEKSKASWATLLGFR